MSAPELWVGLRWARAGLVAALAWGTASAGHLLGGGQLPSAWFIALLVAVTAWPFSVALRARAGRLRMIVLLGVGQAAMHTALVVASWGVGPAPSPGPHGAMGAMAETHLPAPVMEHSMSVLPGPAMILAHLLAAVLLGLVLADADRTLFALLGLIVAPVRRFGRLVLALFLGAQPKSVKATGWAESRAVQRLRQLLFSAAIGRRGPPRVFA